MVSSSAVDEGRLVAVDVGVLRETGVVVETGSILPLVLPERRESKTTTLKTGSVQG